MRRATITLIIGFALFLTGFIALVLMLIGANLSFLGFIDNWGSTVGFVIRLLMVFGGVSMIYVARGKFEA